MYLKHLEEVLSRSGTKAILEGSTYLVRNVTQKRNIYEKLDQFENFLYDAHLEYMQLSIFKSRFCQGCWLSGKCAFKVHYEPLPQVIVEVLIGEFK